MPEPTNGMRTWSLWSQSHSKSLLRLWSCLGLELVLGITNLMSSLCPRFHAALALSENRPEQNSSWKRGITDRELWHIESWTGQAHVVLAHTRTLSPNLFWHWLLAFSNPLQDGPAIVSETKGLPTGPSPHRFFSCTCLPVKWKQNTDYLPYSQGNLNQSKGANSVFN